MTEANIKRAIKQVSTVKSLLNTKTKNGVTTVFKASRELGSFTQSGNQVIAERFGDMGAQKNALSSEADAIDWITENLGD